MRSPNVFYVGDRVEVWVDYQGWRPATLIQVHPNLTVQRDYISMPEPVRRDQIRRPEA